MFQLVGLDHIVLNTSNSTAMVDFYCNILGCHVEKIQEEIGLIQLRAGDSLIDLFKSTENLSQSKVKNLNHFCLRVDPFIDEELKEYFTKNKIPILEYGKRYGAQGVGYSIYIHDPDDNTIELKELASR